MTEQEYKDAVKAADELCDTTKKMLAREYAFSNKSKSVGDIATDGIGSIRIDRVMYNSGSFGALPQAVYEGVMLKKDGAPYKSKETRRVYENNLVDKENREG